MMQHFVSSNALDIRNSAVYGSQLLGVAHVPAPDFNIYVASVWLSTAAPMRSRKEGILR